MEKRLDTFSDKKVLNNSSQEYDWKQKKRKKPKLNYLKING